jgi:ABC-2 type transport system permease protein
MLARIANLTHKEFLQVSRDWVLMVVLVVAPVIQLSLLAWNTGHGIKNLPMIVWDMDLSRPSRELITALDNTDELRLAGAAQSLAQVYAALDQGQADVAVIIPAGFGRNLIGHQAAAQVQILVSGTNSLGGSAGLASAQGAIRRYAASQLAPGAPALPIDFRTDIHYNPTLNSRNYSIPAMIGLLSLQMTLSIASQAFTREREVGTLEQLIIMPFRRLELIIGKAIPPLVITLVDFYVMVQVAIHVFGVPMNGSMLLLMELSFLFMLVEVLWGMFISTLARTQQQAVLFVFVEAILDMTFSGFLVSVDNLPPLLQVVSAVVPLRYYLVIIRSIMSKGATLDVLWPQVAALLALAVVVGLLAVLNVGRRVD